MTEHLSCNSSEGDPFAALHALLIRAKGDEDFASVIVTEVCRFASATDELRRQALEVLAGPRAAYRRYVDARSANAIGGEESEASAAHEMRQAMMDVLAGRWALPDEMRHHLLFALGNVHAGVYDSLICPPRHAGGREAPVAKLAQEDGIRYVRWCEEGLIPDPRPKDTVAIAYQVSTKAVSGWIKAWSQRPVPELLSDGSAAEDAEAVTFAMRASGRYYQSCKADRKKGE